MHETKMISNEELNELVEKHKDDHIIVKDARYVSIYDKGLLITYAVKIVGGWLQRTHMANITCPHCSYEWMPRVAEPKECPKCKRQLSNVK